MIIEIERIRGQRMSDAEYWMWSESVETKLKKGIDIYRQVRGERLTRKSRGGGGGGGAMSSSVVSSVRGGSRMSEPARPIYLMERCLAVRFERLSSKIDAISAVTTPKTPSTLNRINRNKVSGVVGALALRVSAIFQMEMIQMEMNGDQTDDFIGSIDGCRGGCRGNAGAPHAACPASWPRWLRRPRRRLFLPWRRWRSATLPPRRDGSTMEDSFSFR